MTKRLDLSKATMHELLVLTDMLIEVLVEHGDVDLAETLINITVNKPGEDPRIVAAVTGDAIVGRLNDFINETN